MCQFENRTYDLYNWINHFQKVGTIDPNSSVPPAGVIFPGTVQLLVIVVTSCVDGTTNIPSDLSRDIVIGVIYPFTTLAGLTANWYSLTRLAFDQINAQQVVPGFKVCMSIICRLSRPLRSKNYSYFFHSLRQSMLMTRVRHLLV